MTRKEVLAFWKEEFPELPWELVKWCSLKVNTLEDLRMEVHLTMFEKAYRKLAA
jgi:hypothetical protein